MLSEQEKLFKIFDIARHMAITLEDIMVERTFSVKEVKDMLRDIVKGEVVSLFGEEYCIEQFTAGAVEDMLGTIARGGKVLFRGNWYEAPLVSVNHPEEKHMPDWIGETEVVLSHVVDDYLNPSRYVLMTSTDGPTVTGTWKEGDSHTFCRYTGRCVESSNGAMKGWRIAPHEMCRHLQRPEQEAHEFT